MLEILSTFNPHYGLKLSTSLTERFMWETAVQTLNQKWLSHLGERPSIKMNGEHELECITGDSAGALPVASEPEEKPLLTLLPSKIFEHELRLDN